MLIYINILRLFLFHLLPLLLPLVCLSTSCTFCYSTTLHVSSTIVILATIVTFYSSIKKEKEKNIAEALHKIVHRGVHVPNGNNSQSLPTCAICRILLVRSVQPPQQRITQFSQQLFFVKFGFSVDHHGNLHQEGYVTKAMIHAVL